MSIKFTDMAEERREDIIWYERSIITMTLLRLGYLIHNFDNWAMTLSTETDISLQWVWPIESASANKFRR